MNFQETKSVTSTRGETYSASPAERRKVVLRVAVAAVIVAAGFVTFQTVRQNLEQARLAANRPPPLAVSYEIAALKPLPQALRGIGTLAAINGATLSTEAGGTVARIAFTPGARVARGDLLVQLNDSSERADLASFQAQQRVAAQALQRAQSLAQSGAAAKAQLDQAQSQYDVATAGIARAQAAIGKKNIVAPYDGNVGMNLIDVGEYAQPGAPLVVLADNARLYVHFTLPEQVRPQLAVGQGIEFSVDAFPGRTFTAALSVIDPQVAETTRTVGVHAVADNPDGALMAGMYVNVGVKLGNAPDILTIPETALTYALSGNSAFIAEPAGAGSDGKALFKARKAIVRTGASVDGRVVVLDGLKPGDRVLTTGSLKLFDGSPVTLKDDSTLVPPTTYPRS